MRGYVRAWLRRRLMVVAVLGLVLPQVAIGMVAPVAADGPGAGLDTPVVGQVYRGVTKAITAISPDGGDTFYRPADLAGPGNAPAGSRLTVQPPGNHRLVTARSQELLVNELTVSGVDAAAYPRLVLRDRYQRGYQRLVAVLGGDGAPATRLSAAPDLAGQTGFAYHDDGGLVTIYNVPTDGQGGYQPVSLVTRVTADRGFITNTVAIAGALVGGRLVGVPGVRGASASIAISDKGSGGPLPGAEPIWLPGPGGVTLEARAVLPADTFAAGPVSGTLIGGGPFNGRTPPFPSQPVQGISAVLDAGDGAYWVMLDNGYGAKNNSADFLLRVYRVRPTFETARGGPGTVAVEEVIQLRDPDGRVPFPIWHESTTERPLTGWDFDIESFRMDANGDLWFGDEFGPWLLHTDATGKLLEAPFPLPGVKAPQNQTLTGGETPNLGSSRGFEGMAIAPDKRTLYPLLEGALTTDPDRRRLLIHAFDLATGRYTGEVFWYRMEAANHAIGDLTTIDGTRLLVIERDGGQGASARFKRIYEVDLTVTDADGFLVKRELVDLMRVRDPNGISLPALPGDLGLGTTFTFPFVTIESVLPLDGRRLLVINDNNYPFSNGRNPARPDDNEFIILRLDALPRSGD